MKRQRAQRGRKGGKPASGLGARQAAAGLVDGVLSAGQSLSDQLETLNGEAGWLAMDERDRSLARMIAFTAVRRMGQIDAILKDIYPRGLPARAGRLRAIVVTGAAQVLFMQVPSHAAVDLAVRLARGDDKAKHYAPLVNAGLRRIAANGPALVAAQDEARLNTPDWLWSMLVAAYGEADTRAMARAHHEEAGLDLTVKNGGANWSARLGAVVLTNGSVRLRHRGRIEELDGFAAGEWWVQDMAASLPARLLGDVAGKTVIDLCAAPGGKSAQLAHAGARVIAVDQSKARLARVKDNLARLRLDAELVAADALTWRPDALADAVLLDAPCSATGTLRRHPDVARLKSARDIAALAMLQDRLLDNAARMVKPGGVLVYCTCSLDPKEGEARIEAFLSTHDGFSRSPVGANEIGAPAQAITARGELRTLPFMPAGTVNGQDEAESGMDGFFAARLVRHGEH